MGGSSELAEEEQPMRCTGRLMSFMSFDLLLSLMKIGLELSC